MLGEARRCEIHGTVLTATGTCLLCERRGGGGASAKRGMLWLLVGVVGLAIAAAAGLRVHAALQDRAAAIARRDPAPIAAAPLEGAATAATTTVATTATVAATAPTATPSPLEPRVDPSEARREHDRLVAEAERSVQIDLYGEGWCPSCRKARAWLDANSVAYTYRDTSDAVNKHTMRALNPDSTIPTIDVEGQVLVGFSATALRASIRRAAEARVAKSAGAASR